MPRAGVFGSAYYVAEAGVISATFQGTAVNGADQVSYTFPAQAIGTPSATRRVVVAICWAAVSGVLSSASIGGITAGIDLDSGAINGNRRAYLVSAVVPSGTTADIVVTLGQTCARIGIGVWSLSKGGPTGQNDIDINQSTGTLTVATAVGDVVICAGISSDPAVTIAHTWTGAPELYDQAIENVNNAHTGAMVTAVGASTVVTYLSVGHSMAGGQAGFLAAAYR